MIRLFIIIHSFIHLGSLLRLHNGVFLFQTRDEFIVPLIHFIDAVNGDIHSSLGVCINSSPYFNLLMT